MPLIKDIMLASISVFVAVDAIGVLPIYIGLTEGLSSQQRKELLKNSVLTALVVALGFLFAGKILLSFLRITIPDFMVAGGAVLFIFAMRDLLKTDERNRHITDIQPGTTSGTGLGVVPIGVPLIVGPAVLTTVLLCIDVYGYVATLVAVLLNIFFAGFVFLSSSTIIRFLGKSGVRAVSKIASLFLASIAVMLIRRGIQTMIRTL